MSLRGSLLQRGHFSTTLTWIFEKSDTTTQTEHGLNSNTPAKGAQTHMKSSVNTMRPLK